MIELLVVLAVVREQAVFSGLRVGKQKILQRVVAQQGECKVVPKPIIRRIPMIPQRFTLLFIKFSPNNLILRETYPCALLYAKSQLLTVGLIDYNL